MTKEAAPFGFVGVDPGITGTGVALFRAGWDYAWVAHFGTKADQDVLVRVWAITACVQRFVVRGFEQSIVSNDVINVSVEAGFVQFGKRIAPKGLVELKSAIAIALLNIGCRVAWIAPTTMKKHVFGSGREKRKAIEIWDVEGLNENEGDALALAVHSINTGGGAGWSKSDLPKRMRKATT